MIGIDCGGRPPHRRLTSTMAQAVASSAAPCMTRTRVRTAMVSATAILRRPAALRLRGTMVITVVIMRWGGNQSTT